MQLHQVEAVVAQQAQQVFRVLSDEVAGKSGFRRREQVIQLHSQQVQFFDNEAPTRWHLLLASGTHDKQAVVFGGHRLFNRVDALAREVSACGSDIGLDLLNCRVPFWCLSEFAGHLTRGLVEMFIRDLYPGSAYKPGIFGFIIMTNTNTLFCCCAGGTQEVEELGVGEVFRVNYGLETRTMTTRNPLIPSDPCKNFQ
ncbi:hypothetical protein [Hymenobacter terricola]|uniref:hypothetical protein n=1 Tax=Hymenobacter terricola TaxID=2819236 RepID=UPI001B312543|nr:hypothetical protein [Hymenobacter terricola]